MFGLGSPPLGTADEICDELRLQGFHISGSISAEYAATIQEAHERTPAEFLQFVDVTKIRRAIGISPASIYKDTNLAISYPGDPHSSTGQYDPEDRIYWVAEYELKSKANPETAGTPSPSNENWSRIMGKEAAAVYFEEMGHAIDYEIQTTYDGKKRAISGSPSFRDAVEKDIRQAAADGWDFGEGNQTLSKAGHSYAINKKYYGTHGESTEIFARAFGVRVDPDCLPDFARDFPHSVAWMERFISGFRTAWQQGHDAVEKFVYEIGQYGKPSRGESLYNQMSDAIKGLRDSLDWQYRYATPDESRETKYSDMWKEAAWMLPVAERLTMLGRIVNGDDYPGITNLVQTSAEVLFDDLSRKNIKGEPLLTDAQHHYVVSLLQERLPYLAHRDPDRFDALVAKMEQRDAAPTCRRPGDGGMAPLELHHG
jgi:hypothetical protein